MSSKLPETDLVTISERDVIEKAKALYAIWRELPTNGNVITELKHRERIANAQCEVIAAVTLLESREQIRDQLYDPDHLNPDKGGNVA